MVRRRGCPAMASTRPWWAAERCGRGPRDASARSCRHPAAETGHLLTAFTGQCCRGAFRPADGRPPPAATARAGARSRGCPGAGGLSGSPAGHDEHAAGTQDAHGTYLTVSLPTGARRGTTRPHLEQRQPRWRTGADVPVLPHMRVWRSVGPVARPRPGPRCEPSPYRIVRSSRSASNTTARPTAQLRLAAVRRRRPDRTDRPPDRPEDRRSPSPSTANNCDRSSTRARQP